MFFRCFEKAILSLQEKITKIHNIIIPVNLNFQVIHILKYYLEQTGCSTVEKPSSHPSQQKYWVARFCIPFNSKGLS